MLPNLHHRRPPSSSLFQAQPTLWKPVACPQGSSMQLPPAPEVPAQLVDEGSPQTHTIRVQPFQRTSCRITPASGTAEPATTIWNGNTPCRLFITTAAAKHLRQQQPQQGQPSILGIQSTNSLQAQPTLPVISKTPTATGTTAANAGTGGCSGIRMRVR